MADENAPNPELDLDPAEERGRGGQFEAADQSLADALAVSFRVLKWLFVLLLAFFLFSGVFTVEQNEVAVRTSFGRINGDGIAGGAEVLTSEGGPYFRWPRPIGEVYFVPTTERTLRLDDSFVFRTGPRDVGRRLSELNAGNTLDPAVDGSLLTGDRSIVHARYEVRYKVLPQDAADFVRNVAGPEDAARFTDLDGNPEALFQRAERIVRRAVESAIVADVATQDVDDFIRNQRDPEATNVTADAAPPAATDPAAPESPADTVPAEDETRSAADTTPTPTPDAPPADGAEGGTVEVNETSVQATAQRMLDELRTGITIQQVTRSDYTVPPVLRPAFEALSNAEQARGLARSQGRAAYTRLLTGVAGRAYPALLALIDAFEAADRRVQADPDSEEAQQALVNANDALRALFTGQPVGPTLSNLAATLDPDNPLAGRLQRIAQTNPDITLGGEASNVVRTASTESSAIVNQTQTELRRFERLLPDYRRAPELVKRQLFFAMLRDVLSSPDVKLEIIGGSDLLTDKVPEDAARNRADQERALQQQQQPQSGGPPPQRQR